MVADRLYLRDNHVFRVLPMKNLKQIGLIIFLISFTFAFTSTYPDPPLPTPVGRVVWVKGELRAIMPNNEQRLLQKTSLIYLSDILTTDHTSEAQIVFTDNSLLTFLPDTKLSIDQYQYHAKTKSGSVGKYVMNLVEGGFRTITGLIAKNNPSDYQVNTPVATIGVRGTDYAAFVHGGHLSMAYYAGTPCVHNKQGSLCLTAALPYASVGIGTSPVAAKEVPPIFKEKLEIIPAKIGAFVNSNNNNNSNYSGPQKGGPITSFCISQ